VHQLRTENEEEKSNRGDLISENKELKKNEDENDDDVCEVADEEDVYDEKIKNDNNRKEINNYSIKNINNINNLIKEYNDLNKNILKNLNKNDDNIKNIKNEFKEPNENTRNIIKSLNINPIANNIYKMCEICEHTYNLNKLFVAKCEDHYIFKRCTKNYYEEIIEEGKKGLVCPFLTCKEEVDKNKLKNFIISEHYNRLCNE